MKERYKNIIRSIAAVLPVIISAVMFLLHPAEARAEEDDFFVFAAATEDDIIAEPEEIHYEPGDTVRDALRKSGHDFEGIDQSFIYGIDGIAGNFMIIEDDEGYDLDRPASEIRMVIFVETVEYRPGLTELILLMGEYNRPGNNVSRYGPAVSAYSAALTALRQTSDNGSYHDALFAAMEEYYGLINGEKYNVTINGLSDGSPVAGQQIKATDEYGNTFEASGNVIQLPAGTYAFSVSDGGYNRTEGSVTVEGDTEISVPLPTGQWYGEVMLRDKQAVEYLNEKDMAGHTAVFYVPDVKGATDLRYHVTKGDDIPDPSAAKLHAIYVDTRGVDKSGNTLSWASSSQGLSYMLEEGMTGKEFPFEAWYTDDAGYTRKQSFFVTVKRLPTLKELRLLDTAGTNVMPAGFDPLVYEYNVTAADDMLTVDAEGFGSDYTYSVSGAGVSGNTVHMTGSTADITVTVSAGTGDVTVYTLHITKTEPARVTASVPSGTELKVINETGSEIMPSSGGVYALIPGREYTWIATKNEYYHTKASFTAADGMTITAAAPDMADALTALKLYDLRDINTREEYPGDKAFSASVH
ncbi:MAG: cadherin-like beta sandwich domain-containing protein, partial [Lachnospiraceae bacterium]|nr:cadherin-like beta sandwich domain-containing protein [Lachnospiraceae bacterium]